MLEGGLYQSSFFRGRLPYAELAVCAKRLTILYSQLDVRRFSGTAEAVSGAM